jgi:hypothetical protein
MRGQPRLARQHASGRHRTVVLGSTTSQAQCSVHIDGSGSPLEPVPAGGSAPNVGTDLDVRRGTRRFPPRTAPAQRMQLSRHGPASSPRQPAWGPPGGWQMSVVELAVDGRGDEGGSASSGGDGSEGKARGGGREGEAGERAVGSVGKWRSGRQCGASRRDGGLASSRCGSP